jgi:hypothetical protein
MSRDHTSARDEGHYSPEPMGYSLGVDVGTTFTAAAVWRDERVEVVAREAHRVTVPTVIFAAGEDVQFGHAAVVRAASAPDSVAREFTRDDPPWAPDGTRIAFTRQAPGGTAVKGLFVIDADGGNLRQLIDAAWS